MMRDCFLLEWLKDRGVEFKKEGRMNCIEYEDNGGYEKTNKAKNFYCFDCVNKEEPKCLKLKVKIYKSFYIIYKN